MLARIMMLQWYSKRTTSPTISIPMAYKSYSLSIVRSSSGFPYSLGAQASPFDYMYGRITDERRVFSSTVVDLVASIDPPHPPPLIVAELGPVLVPTATGRREGKAGQTMRGAS